jgi:predicted DNA-binding transcriptional regulator YafY
MQLSRKTFLGALGGLVPGLVVGQELAVAKPRVLACFAELGPPMEDDLEFWLSRPRVPVRESENTLVQALIEAVKAGEKFQFIYLGGSSAGEVREISPGLVFMLEEFPQVYVMGYCHRRQQERVFRVDRMRLVIYEE